MDTLKEIIHSLSYDDIREFKLFINRQKKKKNRTDLNLFEILLHEKNEKPKGIVNKLYSNINMNAYHSVRKRLIKHLTTYIVLKRMDEDVTTSSALMGMISLSKYLFENNLNVLGWKQLVKAEEIAISSEQFDLLNTIYNLQIDNCNLIDKYDLKHLIKKRNENKKALDEEERALIAKSIIEHELKKIMLEGKEINFNRVVQKVLNQTNLEKTVILRPKLLYNILSIIRSASVAQKDYFMLEPYIIDTYNKMEEKSGFSKSSHYYKLQILYMICHVLYRNRKFKKAEEFLEILRREIDKFNGVYFSSIFPKYLMLLAVVKSYSGNNQTAIKIHTEALENKNLKLLLKEEHNIRLNLAVYYFNENNYKKSNECILQFTHSDAWYEKKLGKEWVLKKNLIEMIVQYELGHDEIAMNRLRAIETHFSDMFKYNIYQRVKVFLVLVKEYFNKPEIVKNKEFEKKVSESNIYLPDEHEDIRAMAFFLWLKSKMTGKPYYEVLIERVNKNKI
jgi:hypothetical protein